MTDFKGAFQRGLSSSAEAERLRAEAEGVIKDLSRQISEASDGKLTLFLDETFAQKSNRMMAGIARSITGEAQTALGKRTHAIFAEVRVGNTTGGRDSICLVTFAPSTYPVELQWETEVRICHDQEELAYGLQSLVEDPRTGKKFLQKIASHASIASSAGKALSPPTDPSTEPGDEGK